MPVHLSVLVPPLAGWHSHAFTERNFKSQLDISSVEQESIN
jgi:hypothetical protein